MFSAKKTIVHYFVIHKNSSIYSLRLNTILRTCDIINISLMLRRIVRGLGMVRCPRLSELEFFIPCRSVHRLAAWINLSVKVSRNSVKTFQICCHYSNRHINITQLHGKIAEPYVIFLHKWRTIIGYKIQVLTFHNACS